VLGAGPLTSINTHVAVTPSTVLDLHKMHLFSHDASCVELTLHHIPILCWATGWTIRVLEFDSQQRLGIFLFITTSRMALGPTQPPIQWVPGALSLGVKQPGCEADHLPPSSAKVKE
jgi:hypothetical protein